MYIINTIPRGKWLVRYSRTRCFCIRNRTSERRVRKYRARQIPWSILQVYIHRTMFNNVACFRSSLSIRSADCPTGSYSTLNRTCILCPRGTYQPERGRPSCISCGQNMTTPSNGTADKLQCISKSWSKYLLFNQTEKFLFVKDHFQYWANDN